MHFLYDHLEKGSFRTAYSDTDSMCLGLTKSRPFEEHFNEEQKLRALFDPLVRPEKKESWEQNWKSWFCTVSEDAGKDFIIDQRTPDKLKVEFGFSKGFFVGLRKSL